MDAEPYRVALVVDRDFGNRLEELARRVPVWICDSPENRSIAHRVWRKTSSKEPQSGVTVFKVTRERTPEEMCIGTLENVDLHHGEHSHDPPFSVLEVYGTPMTENIRAAAEEFGFCDFEEHENGFVAFRNVSG